jgi:hypothetical protein
MRMRMTGPAFDRVWAEDGAVFFTDAHNHGLQALAWTYSDYLHTVPRLVAQIITALPLTWIAAALTIVASLLSGVIAMLILNAATSVLPRLWAMAVASSVVLTPILAVESLGNLANLQFSLLAVLAWLTAVSNSSRLWRAATATFALFTALTTPLAILVLPASVIAHGWRMAWRHPVVLPALIGCAVQTAAIVVGHTSPFLNPSIRPPLGLHFDAVINAGERLGLPAAVTVAMTGAAAITSSVVVWLAARVVPARRRVILGLLYATGALLVFCVIGGGKIIPRYGVAPSVLIFSIVALLLAEASIRRQLVAVALGLVVVAVWFPAAAVRLSGPSWNEQAAAYNSACTEGVEQVRIAWSPTGWGSTMLNC